MAAARIRIGSVVAGGPQIVMTIHDPPKGGIRTWEGHADAISRLYIHGLLTEAEAAKVRRRLIKDIESELEGAKA